MSDFTARLGMLRGSMPTVARGGERGVRFRAGEMVELTQCRDQTERLRGSIKMRCLESSFRAVCGPLGREEERVKGPSGKGLRSPRHNTKTNVGVAEARPLQKKARIPLS